MCSNFMATVAGPGIGFEAHSRQRSGGEDNYGLPRNEQIAHKKSWLEDELSFEKAQACRGHASFRGCDTSFGGRNYHSNHLKSVISFHAVSRPT